jgi:hypothetical protein
MAGLISGARRYTLQEFIPAKTLDQKYLKEKPLPSDILEKIRKHLGKEIAVVAMR